MNIRKVEQTRNDDAVHVERDSNESERDTTTFSLELAKHVPVRTWYNISSHFRSKA